MNTQAILAKGKAKTLLPDENGEGLIMRFRDDATAFNAEKHAVINGKGILNNHISEHIMLYLAGNGIKTHFIKRLDARCQQVREVKIIPLEVVVRNIAAGSLVKNSNGKYREGEELNPPMLHYFEKNDAKGDPEISRGDILKDDSFMADEKTLAEIESITHKINNLLRGLFDSINITLVDFKLEYGRDDNGALLLADEISPDNCRLWDKTTGEKKDKDRFRQDLGGLVEAYSDIATRLGIDLPPLEKG